MTTEVRSVAEQPALRRHQREALEALADSVAEDARRSWVVLPPGAGKTRVGIEHARSLLDRGLVGTVVAFGPNTAIQSQWAAAWNESLPDPEAEPAATGLSSAEPAATGLSSAEPAATDRALDATFTALTYQSLAVFDAETEVDPSDGLLNDLGPGGRALVENLRNAGPLLLILDECHHLLEVWGTLLAELLDLLGEAWVLGLTATPPAALTKDQSSLVTTLFGRTRYSASIPAVVREGDLAPFADLVWLTSPTPHESQWLAGQAQRFTELTTSLLDPSLGTIPFLEWIDRRFLGTRAEAVAWADLSRSVPDLCSAALRMHHAGLLRLPDGARMTEAHRRDPDVEDWAALIDEWMTGHLLASDDPADARLAEAIRAALPSVGYRFTKKGIRRGRSPVDRVLSHSASKPDATVEIAATEHGNLGDRLRLLVLCDFESATATLSADIRGVLDEASGSALLTLETLAADDRTAGLNPMLVSGKTVAGAPEVLRAFVAFIAGRESGGASDAPVGAAPAVRAAPAGSAGIAQSNPALAASLTITDPVRGIARLEGPWSSRTWVPLVTAFLAAGRTQILVGTRALLGEGWDAPAITGLIDLSAVTTPTAITQTRGRALRRDPGWADKVALNWTVVCLDAEHPRGDQDWDRLVRKHTGFFGTDADGEVVDGIAHIDPEFSVYRPPEPASIDAVNARMIVRSQDRDSIAAQWRVGAECRDEILRSVRIDPAGAQPGLAEVAAGSRPNSAEVAAGAQPGLAEVAVGSRPNSAEVTPGDPAAGPSATPIARTEHGSAPSPTTRSPAEIRVTPRHLGGDPGRILGRVISRWALGVARLLGLTLVCLGAVLWLAISGPGGIFVIVLGIALFGAMGILPFVTGRRRLALYSRPPTVGEIAGSVAEALHEIGATNAGAEAVRLHVDANGTLRCLLDADPASADVFAQALDEAVSPISAPRYLVPRWSLIAPAGATLSTRTPSASVLSAQTPSAAAPTDRASDRAAASAISTLRSWWERLSTVLRAGVDEPQKDGAVWHPVPSRLGGKKEHALAFARAWDRWVGGEGPEYTGSPTGSGILVANRDASPLALTSVLRSTWV